MLTNKQTDSHRLDTQNDYCNHARRGLIGRAGASPPSRTSTTNLLRVTLRVRGRPGNEANEATFGQCGVIVESDTR